MGFTTAVAGVVPFMNILGCGALVTETPDKRTSWPRQHTLDWIGRET